MAEQVLIREIKPADNAEIATIIRSSLAEFGAAKPGTVYFDPTTDDLHTLFRQPRSRYYVAESEGKLLGGCGIFPSPGLPEGTCELVKMYLRPEARGLGLGRKMVAMALDTAREMGYRRVYLETMPELAQAVKVYERFGFERLCGPMGDTGHFGCDMWMILNLYPQEESRPLDA